jgi:hypothetical protein
MALGSDIFFLLTLQKIPSVVDQQNKISWSVCYCKVFSENYNGTARFKKCKQLYEYKHLLSHLVVKVLIHI